MTVQRAILEHGRLKAVLTTCGDVEADVFVLCLPNGAAAFARSAGFHLPIQPIKGYSLTLWPKATSRLGVSVTDLDNKIVFAPLARGAGSAIRATGIADLVGADLALDARRLDIMRRLTAATLDVEAGHDEEP